MVFSSTTFLFLFLPIVALLYFVSQKKYQNYILLLASLIFYSIGEPKFVFIMIGSIIINYFAAIFVDLITSSLYRKIILFLDVVINIGILYVFKYLDFTINIINKFFHSNHSTYNIALPIGISFFTFQAISYVVDVYRKEVQPQKNLFYVALYISFFPQLIAGPIVRYDVINDNIENRCISLEKYSTGVKRFIVGLGKKIIFANNLSLVVERYFSNNISDNSLLLWIASICFTLQIYFDFSGYSDMAIGLGTMFGFDIPENFNYPYIAKSVKDFWKRWHISLSSWFKDYVYIPLGGSRVSVPRNILNLFVVWSLTGIWHGANWTFIFWGMFYFTLLILEKYIIKPNNFRLKFSKYLWQFMTLLFVNIGFVFFKSPDINFALRYLYNMFGFGSHTFFVINNEVIMILKEYGLFIVGGIFLSTPLLKKERNNSLIYLLTFIIATSYMILDAHNPFLYFNF